MVSLPRPNPEELSEYYSEGDYTGEEDEGVERVRSSNPSVDEFVNFEKMAEKRLEVLFKSKAFEILSETDGELSSLDIGSGHGAVPHLLREYGFSSEGLELDLELAEASAQYYNLKIYPESFEDFKTSKKYDLITTFHVMEHVLDPDQFLKKIRVMLNDDGILNIEVPIIDIIYTGELKSFFWLPHINTFSIKTLASLLRKNGFKILFNSKNERPGYFFGNIVAQKSDEFILEFDKDEFKRVKAIIKAVDNYNGPPLFLETSKS